MKEKQENAGDRQLSLENVRNVLIRLEQTLLFGMLERAQYRRNRKVYSAGALGTPLGNASLLEVLLRDCERSHARVRRYTSPDEHPFFDGLPKPILPPLGYADNPLLPNTVNLNARILGVYLRSMLPLLCRPGDDRQYGSSAVHDVYLLQALSKRIHYGKFVAESKYRAAPERFDPLIRRRSVRALVAAVTDAAVERRVLRRVAAKAAAYNRELEPATGAVPLPPERVRTLYERWIIPLNKRVQAEYLIQTRSRRQDRSSVERPPTSDF